MGNRSKQHKYMKKGISNIIKIKPATKIYW